MIRPEIHQWNWKPKTRSKDDIKLDKDLEILRKKLNVRKNELTRMALSRFSIVNEIKLLKSNQEVK
tara:strand:+ start:59 stop:256 length:198 start_codon:yes stop_codon:yes gene_type:complete